MTSRGPASVLAMLSALALGAAACSDGHVAAAPPSAAVDGSASQAVAGFACPEAATTAGVDRVGPADGERLQVVTTVAPLTSIVANVAGASADITGLVPEGTNSHTYEPKPSVAAAIASADVVFLNGLQLEEPTRELAEGGIADGAQIVELGSLTVSPEQYLYDFSFPRDGGKPNPHLWTDPPMARCYAAIVASVLARADPANASSYRANLDAFGARLDELDRLMVEATGSVPPAQRRLLTYHDAYAYFAAHYGWEVVGAVQMSDFEEPSAREVARLIEQLRNQRVRAIFGSEVFPSPVLEQIAEETGTEYVDTLRDDDLPGAPGDAEHSYLGLMQYDFATMVRSLGGNPSGLLAFDPADVVADRAEYPQ